jgi:hypothetical protein
MPEGPEVDTDKLHETIEEEIEKGGGRFLKQVALSTAIFAAFAAIASLRAGATVNEALVLNGIHALAGGGFGPMVLLPGEGSEGRRAGSFGDVVARRR